jgi:predicted nucleic-acid-binding Zn-ribbon protein
MDDSNGHTRFAAYLNSKKAGPLVCPICKATESFEAKGTLAGSSSDPLTSSGPPASPASQFNYATCTNCGYSIFFDTGAIPLPE